MNRAPAGVARCRFIPGFHPNNSWPGIFLLGNIFFPQISLRERVSGRRSVFIPLDLGKTG